MQCRVCFKARRYVARKPAIKIGLKYGRELAKQFQVPLQNIHPFASSEEIPRFCHPVALEEAIKLHIFEDTSEITVQVPDYALNKYMKLLPYRVDDIVAIRWVLDAQQIFSDWIAVGCPKRWDPLNRNMLKRLLDEMRYAVRDAVNHVLDRD